MCCCLFGLAAPGPAKRPAQVPQPAFAMRVPQGWLSPEPGRWISPDGLISLCWTEVDMKGQSLPEWVVACQRDFRGELLGPPRSTPVGKLPAWSASCRFQGRLQRIYWLADDQRGVILVCSYTVTQNFAGAAVLQEALSSFRWIKPAAPRTTERTDP